jgi:hypothetical protein
VKVAPTKAAKKAARRRIVKPRLGKKAGDGRDVTAA